MKRFALSFVLLVLVGCLPQTQTSLLTYSRAGDVISLTATVGPEMVVSSSEDINAWLPVEACVYQQTSGGPMRSVICKAPGEYVINTSGTVSAQLFDGFRPVTPPVIIPSGAN